jgi:2-polyprenyl-6-methoxyphenol hydroxylase-like FAD-dependent oxidoreductase
VADFDLGSKEEGNMYEIWANVKGLRVGYSKINERQVYLFITNFEKSGGKDNLETLKEDILRLCTDFPDTVKHIIAVADVNNINRTDLFDFKPISNWIDRKAALIGDAAHATTPNLGQGACQAIEDAFVIAQELSINPDVETCFRNFQQKRIKKATYITNTSWQFARMTNTSGVTKSFVKSILRLTPNFFLQRQLDKIYSLDC